MNKTVYTSREKVAEGFAKFIPSPFVSYVVDLFLSSPVKFKIVSGRKTKLGDFRPGRNGEKDRITVNGDLNAFAFLVTTLHEFAHLLTHKKFGNTVLPHGEEWKKEFRSLLLPVIESNDLPKDITRALTNYLINTKASSCSDQGLQRALMAYDLPKDGLEVLERLPKNSTFMLEGKRFVKGVLRRKRFVCQELDTDRTYLVNALARVAPLIDENYGK